VPVLVLVSVVVAVSLTVDDGGVVDDGALVGSVETGCVSVDCTAPSSVEVD